MYGLLNFSMAFLLLAFATFVIMGKADFLMGKYRLTFKDGKLKYVKFREYDVRRARPLFALILFVLVVFILLEYVFRPLPEWCAFVVLGIILPIALYMEIKCRKKE